MPRKEAEDHVNKDSTGELKCISFFFSCVASGNITELKLKSLLLPNDILRYLKHYRHGFLPYPSNSFFL